MLVGLGHLGRLTTEKDGARRGRTGLIIQEKSRKRVVKMRFKESRKKECSEREERLLQPPSVQSGLYYYYSKMAELRKTTQAWDWTAEPAVSASERTGEGDDETARSH